MGISPSPFYAAILRLPPESLVDRAAWGRLGGSLPSHDRALASGRALGWPVAWALGDADCISAELMKSYHG